ncbi:MAG: deoxyribodipyrimidine photo-lyase [Planctomycetota bacterium]|jgi:deoxyribodipyrimidine photo-lyase
MIQPEHIELLNNQPIRDRSYVLYWMQAAQRAEYNHALQNAIELANKHRKPILVAFSLTDHFPEANLRHYAFMLQGLKETQAALAKRDIKLIICKGAPEEAIAALCKQADLLITDDGYLRIQQQWRSDLSTSIDCAMYEVTTNVIVPIEQASDKENYSAGTLRPRITKQLEKKLIPIKHTNPKQSSLNLKLKSLDITDADAVLKKLNLDRSVSPSPVFTGGTSVAKKRLKRFVTNKLNDYPYRQNDPNADCQSHLSPYLHFGQISPLYIALQITKSNATQAAKDAFLEQLIVRRELAYNFVYYNNRYDDFDALPHWCLRTLNYHKKDKRDYTYTLDRFENAQTHDPYWNAAQNEMQITGKMHNYMRMYWGKKILEWTKSPKDAFYFALYLNNKYELDGRDPNGFAGVAWCFGKHDRPWTERPVFGKVRYMNAAGLKRKFDIDAYVETIERLERKYTT